MFISGSSHRLEFICVFDLKQQLRAIPCQKHISCMNMELECIEIVSHRLAADFARYNNKKKQETKNFNAIIYYTILTMNEM